MNKEPKGLMITSTNSQENQLSPTISPIATDTDVE